jgi:GcrA cell cycle regulator
MEQSNWAPEHSDALRELIAKGLSFAEAARAINSRFKTSYTRSAALGRARRLRLGPDDRQQPSMPRRPAELDEIVERLPISPRPLGLPWPTPVFKEVVPVKLRCVDIEPRHLSLTELERGDCRYPYGGDEESEVITFCGHPRRPGSSYCSPHFHLSRDPVELPLARHFAMIGEGDTAKTVVSCVADRLKLLPRRHRIAHLRALIELQPEGRDRRDELAGLLQEEIVGASSDQVSL